MQREAEIDEEPTEEFQALQILGAPAGLLFDHAA
jgi:hypothetical protein